ncbi:DUF3817 domain-containing protein [Nakamurella antarctica]|nr:DUF3817 domain-containing protein [Nakamurella antarctica]
MTPKVATALQRFKILSIAESIALIILVVLIVLKYGFDKDVFPLWPQIHGLIFFVYFLLTLDLGFKARWKPLSTLLVILSGIIPLVSFWAERIVARKVNAGERL